MKKSFYKQFETTGDIGVYIYGKGIKELFINGGQALFDLMVRKRRKATEKKEIKLNAESLQRLFIIWLNELIFLFDTYGLVASRYDIKVFEESGSYVLSGSIMCFTNDESKGSVLIKAATYHNFFLKETEDGYEARVLFDI